MIKGSEKVDQVDREPKVENESSVVSSLKNQLEVKDNQLTEIGKQNTKLLELLNNKLSK